MCRCWRARARCVALPRTVFYCVRRTPLRVDSRSYSGLPLRCIIFDTDRFYKKTVSDLIALMHRNEPRIEELIRFLCCSNVRVCITLLKAVGEPNGRSGGYADV